MGLSLGSGVKKMVEMTRVEVAGLIPVCLDPSGSPDSGMDRLKGEVVFEDYVSSLSP